MQVCSGDLRACETEAGIPTFTLNSWHAMIRWLPQQIWSSRRRLLTLIVCQATVYYHIWTERNDRKNGRSSTTFLAIFKKVREGHGSILLARRVHTYSTCGSSIANLAKICCSKLLASHWFFFFGHRITLLLKLI